MTQNEVNKVITVKANYTDGFGANESVTSSATNSIVNVNDAPNGSVNISGTPTQGETLTATNNITDVDGMGSISYQWYANGVLINGATNSTYTLTQNEVNKVITVKANYTDALNTVEVVTSSATTSVINVNDAPTVLADNIDVNLSFGDSYTKNISGLFNDIDFNNIFTFEASNLPLGLSIDPTTGVISGKANESGEFVVTIKATDNGNPALNVSRTYKIFVLAPAQVEAPQTPTVGSQDNNTPTNTLSNITISTFTDTVSLGTINNNVGTNNSADSVGIGYVASGTPVQTNNTDNTTPNIPTAKNNGNYIEADAKLNINPNGQVSFDKATQDSFSIVGLKIEDLKIDNNRLDIKIVDTNRAQSYIVTQLDGTALPTGLAFNPRTGSISGIVPENLDKLDISVKATNPDGTTRVLNIKLDLKQLKQKTQAEIDERFIGFKEQLAFENEKIEGYGSYLAKLFA